MAQSGYTPIQLYYSTTASATPSAGNLLAGELALNTLDEKLYFKNSSGTVKLLASNAASSATVSSVAMSVPAFLSVSGSPITTSGTLAVTYSGTALPTANGGTGSTSTTYCSLTTNVTGTLPIANGGTGSTSTTYCSLTTNVTGTLPVANGGSGATTLTGVLKGNGTSAFTAATAGTDYVAPGTATTFTATQTFNGSSSTLAEVLANAAETVNIVAGTNNANSTAYFNTGSVSYYTSNNSSLWTQNLTFSSGTTLNSVMSVGQSLTLAILSTNGGTAYYPNGFQVDGNSVTPKWQGGTAPSSGNASSIDVYTYTVIKTASATFTVLASQTKFA